MSKIAESVLSKVKVRFYKKTEDDRTSLCGEPMQIDEKGREFFEIPAHQADYISKVFPHYEMGEEFIPEKKEKVETSKK